MPWTPSDAKRHKKNLSPKQARMWAHVANSALSTCLKRGRSRSHCEGVAVRSANAAVGAPARPTSNADLLVVHAALTAAPQRLRRNEQDYLIAPCVMLVAGVLNQGLVLNEAIVPSDWNGVPVVVQHPQGPDGVPISARAPDVLDTCGIGHVYHARTGQGVRAGSPVTSLVAELWINLADAARCGGEAAQAVAMLDAQQPLEVSTAFYPDVEPRVGTFYGTPYQEVYTRLRPDHLALLPNGIGACDWSAGCGSPRLNAHICTCPGDTCTCPEGVHTMADPAPLSRWQRFWAFVHEFMPESGDEDEEGTDTEEPSPAAVSEASIPSRGEEIAAARQRQHDGVSLTMHEQFILAAPEAYQDAHGPMLTLNQTDVDIREALYGCFAREYGADTTPIYIMDIDVTTQTFRYRQGERLVQRSWTVEEDLIHLSDDETDVQRSTTYTVVPGSQDGSQALPSPDTNEEEPRMAGPVTPTIKARVDALITNTRRAYTELDRGRLEALDEATLMILEQQPLAALPVEPDPPREGYLTLAEALQNVAPEVAEAVEEATAIQLRRKNSLIELLVNEVKDNPFSREALQGMKIEPLEKLIRMAGFDVPGQTRPLGAAPNYSGRRMPHLRIVSHEDGEDDGRPPPLPDTTGLVVEEQRRRGIRF
jgi:hypothetical protein